MSVIARLVIGEGEHWEIEGAPADVAALRLGLVGAA